MKRLITIALCTFLSQMCTAQVMMLFSSDSLTNITSPLDVDSLFYWFAADVGVTDSLGGAIATDEGVGTWNDLSGNGYHVTQSTDGARPVYKATGGPGSKPCIQFSDSDDFLISADHWWGSDDFSIFFVVKYNQPTGTQTDYVLCRIKESANRQWFCYTNNDAGGDGLRIAIRQDAPNTIVSTFSATRASSYQLVAHIHPGSNPTTLFVDGASSGIASTTGTGDGTVEDAIHPLEIGSVYRGTAFTTSDFSISEIIVYSRALTATERAAIENYLNRKYDLY